MNRQLRALIRKTFRSGSTMKTTIPAATFIVSLVFVLAIITVFAAVSIGFWRAWRETPSTPGFVLVNAPDSFIQYMDENSPESFRIDSYHTTDAYYDFITFGKWMRETDSDIAVVFPTDFDEQIKSHDTSAELPSVLTYFRSDSLQYRDIDTDFKDGYLNDYHTWLKEAYGIRSGTSTSTLELATTPVSTRPDMDFPESSSRWASSSIIPLMIFITILYSCASVGTNVIAGEKEQGTFAGILLTPVSRRDIIIGNTLGVALRALMPAVMISSPFLLNPYYRNWGFIQVLILILSLALLIAAVTILISSLNESVISAQTAFLPVFLILIMVCVTCIQDSSDHQRFYYWFPVYGHFYGIGSAYMGEAQIIDTIICVLTTLILTGICYLISEKVLHMEQFTTYSTEPDDKKASRRSAGQIDIASFLFNHAIRPLWLLTIFQLLAMIPLVVIYMRKAQYSDFILGLKDVTGTADIIKQTFGIMDIFMNDPLFIMLLGCSYILIITSYIVRTRVRENLPLSSMGLTSGSPLKKYGTGALTGFVMITTVWLIMRLSGKLTGSGYGLNSNNIRLFTAFVFMWIPQGAAEEIMFRGYLIPRVEKRTGKIFAIIFSSLLFSIFHSLNPGFSVLALINLTLIAVFFALVYEYTGSIWMTCAAHSVWNFCQGNIYGLEVSGNSASASILVSEYSEGASAIWTGGSFGPEGSIAVTIVSIAMIALVSFLMYRKKSTPDKRSADRSK